MGLRCLIVGICCAEWRCWLRLWEAIGVRDVVCTAVPCSTSWTKALLRIEQRLLEIFNNGKTRWALREQQSE